MDETLAVVPQRDQESNPKPLRSEAEESRGAGSAALRQLRPDYTMSCWWGTLRFSVQGLSLSCYNSFHKGQLINTLLWGTEENEPFGGLRKTSPGDVTGHSLYTKHTKGLTEFLSNRKPLVSRRARKRRREVLSLQRGTAVQPSVFVEMMFS